MSYRLVDEERQLNLPTCTSRSLFAVPPGQIVSLLVDRALFNSCGEDLTYGSERSFYRVLHAHGQAHCRGKARLLQELRPVPRLRADGPDEVLTKSHQGIVVLIG